MNPVSQTSLANLDTYLRPLGLTPGDAEPGVKGVPTGALEGTARCRGAAQGPCPGKEDASLKLPTQQLLSQSVSRRDVSGAFCAPGLLPPLPSEH